MDVRTDLSLPISAAQQLADSGQQIRGHLNGRDPVVGTLKHHSEDGKLHFDGVTSTPASGYGNVRFRISIPLE